MADTSVSYLAFDIESIADGQLVSRIRYPGEGLDPQKAVARYREELLEKYESDFVPYTFHVPISVAVGKISADYRLLDVIGARRAAVPAARDHRELFARVGQVPPADASELQRADVRFAAAGAGRVSLRHQPAGVVQHERQELRAESQPLQSRWRTSTCRRFSPTSARRGSPAA